MFEINHDLYRISPLYRRLISDLHRLQSENGALGAAYGNAVNDHQRSKTVLNDLAQTMHTIASSLESAGRDDPGRGGSGGSR